MKQALHVNIQIEKDDHTYIFSMPYGAKIGEAHDVLHEMLEAVIKMAQDSVAAVKNSTVISEEGVQ